MCLLPFKLISRVTTETDISGYGNISLFGLHQIPQAVLLWPCTLCGKGAIIQTDPSSKSASDNLQMPHCLPTFLFLQARLQFDSENAEFV